MASLDERMLRYEGREARRALLPRVPICMRLDGKCFHALTRHCDRPFDGPFSQAMRATAVVLAEEFGAVVAHTQSDEISLILYNPDPRSEPYLGGRVQKLASIAASLASVTFERDWEARQSERPPVFDCRVWSVPDLDEAVNVILWRENDAARNSVQMAARSVYSHKDCHNKNTSQLQERLHQKGVNWNDYPICFKRGTLWVRKKVLRCMSAEERMVIPEAHRPPEGHVVERQELVRCVWPRLTKITNRVDALFDGAFPEETTDAEEAQETQATPEPPGRHAGQGPA